MTELRNGSETITSLFHFFEDKYLQTKDKEQLQVQGGLFFKTDGFLGDLLNSLPEIQVDKRQEYFEENLPFRPKSDEFSNILLDSSKLPVWNNFIFLLRRTVEMRDIKKASYRYSEPVNNRILSDKAFTPSGHNKLNIDDSLGFMRPY